jgi:phage terminase large subunit
MNATVVRLPTFRGGNLDLLLNHDHEVIVSGGADTGKTWAGCVKSYMLCTDRHRPKVHGCMVRKTYNSIQESCARTFNTITAKLPIERMGGRAHTERWIFPNGSELVTVGMDNPDRLLSSEWDFIQVVQAEQLAESDWETIGSRCTGRGATVAFPQIFGDCNPGGSRHWIRERAKTSKLTLLTTTHKDNPALFDDAGNVTTEGQKRIGILEATLSGVRRKRLLEGVWATAEGAVYDTFDATKHVRQRPDAECKRWFLAVDEGYTNPAVVLLVGEDGDGRQHIAREWYHRGQLQSAVVSIIREWNTEKRCELVAVDESAAGLIADLQAVGVRAIGGKGRVLDGIQRVQDRLKVQGDGRPRLTVDPSCENAINEFESYVWHPDKPKDTPIKEHDHVLDSYRYLQDVMAVPTGAWSSRDIQAVIRPVADDGLNLASAYNVNLSSE